MVKKKVYDTIGGFDENAKVAEDYLFSKEIKPNKFYIMNTTVFTSPRRFKQKGLWYMTKLMIQSFLNRNNKEYFSNYNSYWK